MKFLIYVPVYLLLVGTNLVYADGINFNGMSNCREWELIEFNFIGHFFQYKGKTVLLAQKHYACHDDNGSHFVFVFYRPVSEKELWGLSGYPDSENRSLQLAESKS